MLAHVGQGVRAAAAARRRADGEMHVHGIAAHNCTTVAARRPIAAQRQLDAPACHERAWLHARAVVDGARRDAPAHYRVTPQPLLMLDA